MLFRSFALKRRASIFALALAAVAATGVFAVSPHVFAEDGPDAAETKSPEVKPADRAKKKHRGSHKAVSKVDTTKSGKGPTEETAAKESRAKDVIAKGASTPDDVTASVPKQASKPSDAIDFAAQLGKAGATTCTSQVNALATATMGSVEKFNTVSNWSQTGSDKRAVSIAIGQKFATGSAVPFGLAQVISAPNREGSCDGFTVQVFPSPLSCAKLRDTIKAQRGQQIGDLAGIPLMQDAGGRTMLVPTASDTCVLVATKSFYAK